jgi:hypothetical protein
MQSLRPIFPKSTFNFDPSLDGTLDRPFDLTPPSGLPILFGMSVFQPIDTDLTGRNKAQEGRTRLPSLQGPSQPTKYKQGHSALRKPGFFCNVLERFSSNLLEIHF